MLPQHRMLDNYTADPMASTEILTHFNQRAGYPVAHAERHQKQEETKARSLQIHYLHPTKIQTIALCQLHQKTRVLELCYHLHPWAGVELVGLV